MNPWDQNIARDWYLRFHASVKRFNDGAMWTLIAYENSFHAGEYSREIYTRVFQRFSAESTEHKVVWGWKPSTERSIRQENKSKTTLMLNEGSRAAPYVCVTLILREVRPSTYT